MDATNVNNLKSSKQTANSFGPSLHLRQATLANDTTVVTDNTSRSQCSRTSSNGTDDTSAFDTEAPSPMTARHPTVKSHACQPQSLPVCTSNFHAPIAFRDDDIAVNSGATKGFAEQNPPSSEDRTIVIIIARFGTMVGKVFVT